MFEKPAHQMIAPEEMQTGIMYAFTINPSDNHQFYGEEERVDKFHKRWQDILGSNLVLNGIADLDLTLEVSKMGRLHYHGVITVLDKISFYVDFIPKIKNMCTFELDTMSDSDKWKKYCIKQDLFHKYITSAEILTLYRLKHKRIDGQINKYYKK